MMQAQDFPLISHSPKRWGDFVRKRTPILESIVPLDCRQNRDWRRMGDDALEAHGKWIVAGLGIDSRAELDQADSGLCAIIRKRGLMDAVGLKNKNAMDRNWGSMSDDEIVMLTERMIAERKISGRMELGRYDRGLYNILSKRELWARLPFPKARETKDWAHKSNDELLSMAKEIIMTEGITSRYRFSILHKNLYDALRKRELLGEIGLRSSKEDGNRWTGLDDVQVLSFSSDFIRQNGVQTRAELRKIKGGYSLYKVLQRRRLLDEIDFPKEKSRWRGMGDEQLVEYARKIFSEIGFGRRGGVSLKNPPLYAELRRRGLVEKVFSDVEFSRHKDAVAGVLDALESFGDGK